MHWFKKGDIVRVNGKPAIVDSDVYTKVVYDCYDDEIARSGGEGGSAVTCVNVVFPDTGIKWTVKTINVTAMGREFP
jgi:hypothetical protein